MRAERTGASRKYGTALVFLICGTLLGVWHNRRIDSGQQDLVSGAVRTAVAPPAGAVNNASRWLSDKTGWLFKGKDAADENVRLRKRLAQLEEEVARLREVDIKLKQLKGDLGFATEGMTPKIPATVLSQSPDPKYATILISRGSRDGVRPHSVVVTRQGLVGQVSEVTPTTATVVLLTEQSGGVGARVQRAESRTFGICKGDNAGTLWMYHLPNDANIKKGDLIVSSGMGEVYPSGIVIGTVAEIQPDEENVNKKAKIIAAVAFDRLEDVYVLP
jgi:rod shape-determining protein MreC